MARRSDFAKAFRGTVQWRDSTIDDFQKGLLSIADELELQIQALAAELTINEGRFVEGADENLGRLASIQDDIDQALRASGYTGSVTRYLQEAKRLKGRVTKKYAEQGLPASFTQADTETFQAALGANFDAFANIGKTAAATLKEGLERAVLNAEPFESWRDELRRVLKGSGRKDKAGQGMFRHAHTLADTAMTQLHRRMEDTMARKADIQEFVYYGPMDEVTRPFCNELMRQSQDGKRWTREEIAKLDNSRKNGGAGTGKGTAFEQGGGWNCRHLWMPALDSAVAGGRGDVEDPAPRELDTEPVPPIRTAKQKTTMPKEMKLPNGETVWLEGKTYSGPHHGKFAFYSDQAKYRSRRFDAPDTRVYVARMHTDPRYASAEAAGSVLTAKAGLRTPHMRLNALPDGRVQSVFPYPTSFEEADIAKHLAGSKSKSGALRSRARAIDQLVMSGWTGSDSPVMGEVVGSLQVTDYSDRFAIGKKFSTNPSEVFRLWDSKGFRELKDEKELAKGIKRVFSKLDDKSITTVLRSARFPKSDYMQIREGLLKRKAYLNMWADDVLADKAPPKKGRHSSAYRFSHIAVGSDEDVAWHKSLLERAEGKRLRTSPRRRPRATRRRPKQKFDPMEWSKLSIPDRHEKFSKLRQRERDDLADPEHSIPNRLKELTAHAERPDSRTKRQREATRMTPAQRRALSTDARRYVVRLQRQATFRTFMDDDADLISDEAQNFASLLFDAGVGPEDARELTMSFVENLVAQERESLSRSLGDHGARHLLQNAKWANQILDEVAKGTGNPVTSRDKVKMYLTTMFHDTGYMSDPARIFMDDDHPHWSALNYKANWGDKISAIFGEDFSDDIARIIETHDGTDLDWYNDPTGSAYRLSDNIALFHKEKLPAVVKYVPKNRDVLEQLGAKKIDVDTARKLMRQNVVEMGLPSAIEESLLAAADEVSPVLPKFTLGMYGSHIEKLEWVPDLLVKDEDIGVSSVSAGEGGFIRLVIQRNEDEDQAITNVLDLGEKQFEKFAKTYDLDPDELKTKRHVELGAKGQTKLMVDVHERGKRSVVERPEPQWSETEFLDPDYAYMDEFAAQAEYRHMSVDQMKRVTQKATEKLIEESDVFVRVEEDSFHSIIRDRRLKTQFEVGQSNGWYWPEERARLENAVFGAKEDLPATHRPIYGYLSNDSNGNQTSAEGYGRVRIKLRKDRVKKRTTWTGGDSMDGMHDAVVGKEVDIPFARMRPSTLEDPKWYSWDFFHQIGTKDGGTPYPDELLTQNDMTFSYMEAQVWGGVEFEDIDEVILPTRDLVERFGTELTRAGIPWRSSAPGVKKRVGPETFREAVDILETKRPDLFEARA